MRWRGIGTSRPALAAEGVQETKGALHQAFTDVLETHGVAISMDGKGRYRDNIFLERLWRSVKYECIYLKAFKDGSHLKQELGRYFAWYNQERPHQGLVDAISDEMYFLQPVK